jgi:hypothetical protein
MQTAGAAREVIERCIDAAVGAGRVVVNDAVDEPVERVARLQNRGDATIRS